MATETRPAAQTPTPNRLSPQSAHQAVGALVSLYDGILFENSITIAALSAQLERTQGMLKDANEAKAMLEAENNELNEQITALTTKLGAVVPVQKSEATDDPLS